LLAGLASVFWPLESGWRSNLRGRPAILIRCSTAAGIWLDMGQAFLSTLIRWPIISRPDDFSILIRIR
jgi:hypothetical protein